MPEKVIGSLLTFERDDVGMVKDDVGMVKNDAAFDAAGRGIADVENDQVIASVKTEVAWMIPAIAIVLIEVELIALAIVTESAEVVQIVPAIEIVARDL